MFSRFRRYRRTMSVAVDPAFKAVSKTHTGFHIWRIENMQVVPVPKATWGSFYDGDSYIIFAASEYGKPASADAKVYEVKGTGLEMHIHFWLGHDTSQDEAGVAAYKTVELDDYLGGSPTQHREAQGTESGRFKSYFRTGITILKGGIASGFNTVTDDFEPKLFHVKGRRQPTVTQLPSISWEHFNSGDVFILDTKDIVFLWIGKEANAAEKLKAAVVAGKLRDDHNAQSLVFVDDGDEQDMHSGEKKVFQNYLKLSERVIKSAEEAGDDDEAAEALRNCLTLYQCSDEDGTYKVTELKSGPLYQSDLLPEDSFIVDNGTNGCWVWIGRRTSQKERIEAVRNAHGFVTKKGYPSSTPVTRVVDGGEPTEFKVLFSSWKVKTQANNQGRSGTGRLVTIHTKLDSATLYEKTQLAADNQLWDDGTGTCTVWRIKQTELEEVPQKRHGLFFAGDSYVIHYSYWANGSEHQVLYYWLGEQCTDEEKEAATLAAEAKDNELNNEGVLVRVVQGKEPAHFLTMFHRGILIFNGGYTASEDGSDVEDTGIPQTFLLHVRGNYSFNTRATQVELRAASLNTNDVFVLKGKNNCFVWSGKGSTGDEREMAKHIAEVASKGDFAFVSEGQEKADFWDEIGGEEDYTTEKRYEEESDRLPARLFQLIRTKSGSIKVDEIINFMQADLISEDIMVLDIHDTIYLWIGKDSSDAERQKVISAAVKYLEKDPKGRDKKTPIVQVKQGFEPPTFTGFFASWDPSLWDNTLSFEQMRMQIEEANPIIAGDGVDGNYVDEENFDDYPKYPLEFLQETAPEDMPEDVDKFHKELHLSREDFEAAFRMDPQNFTQLPAWKQTNLKKSVRLF